MANRFFDPGGTQPPDDQPHQYCARCGEISMVTLVFCPRCGTRWVSPLPLSLPALVGVLTDLGQHARSSDMDKQSYVVLRDRYETRLIALRAAPAPLVPA